MPEPDLGEVMAENAQKKGTFLLSEVLARAGNRSPVPRAAAELWPLFTTLDLVTERVPGDLRLRRKEPSPQRTLSPDECQRLDAFFRHPFLPFEIENSIRQYINEKTGKAWNDPSVLQKIRHAIISQKDEYWREGREKKVVYRKGYAVLGYLAYQAPVFFVQAEHLLYGLALAGLLKRSMRVLDLGCGPGVVPLAINDFFRRIGGCTADIYAIEQSEEFIEAYRFLAERTLSGGDSVTLHPPLKGDIGTMPLCDIPPSLDLIIFQNALNEMTALTPRERGKLVQRYAKALSSDGSILIVEPADMVNSMELREVAHHAAASGLFLHAPCRFLWNVPCVPQHCWSFVEKPPINATELMEALATGDEGYRYRNTDIKYSYALLRKAPPQAVPGLPLSSRSYARLSTLSRHLNRRINVAGVVLSGNLGDQRTYVYKICDGTAGQPVYAILPSYHLSGKNDALLSIPYGSIAEFTSVLVRFNQKHRAYNLLVTRESRVREYTGRGRSASLHRVRTGKKDDQRPG
jgi:SAM-dependent methyltransferase